MTVYVIYITLLAHDIEIINVVQTLDEAVEMCKYDDVNMSWNPMKGLMTIRDHKSGYTAYIKRTELV